LTSILPGLGFAWYKRAALLLFLFFILAVVVSLMNINLYKTKSIT
jgi:hypothetical protein